MNPVYYFLPVLLAYIVWRAVSHFRAKRIQFFIVTCFIGAIVAYEIALGFYRYYTNQP